MPDHNPAVEWAKGRPPRGLVQDEDLKKEQVKVEVKGQTEDRSEV
jgi:hypothetical protein